MALATRPKPKVQHRKRVAQHHKHTTHYLKVYGPYLPALAIVGIGLVVSSFISASGALFYAGANLQGVSNPTRIEAITGNTNGVALGILVVMAGGAFAILLFQHWFRIQRTLNKGEAFVAKHPWVDLALVLVATAGVVLSRQVI